MPRQITSFSNETVKRLRALRDKKARRNEGLFLAEGLRILAEARDSGSLPEIIAYSPAGGVHPLAAENPGKSFIPANRGAVCGYMKMITLPKLRDALRDAGHDRTIGICDGANAAQSAVARWFDVPEKAVRTEVFGLNHLSFTRRAEIGGEDVLPRLLADDAFLAASAQKVFSPRVVRRHGMWINEYLYYFYYAEKAVEAIRSDSRTRGEEVRDLNHGLIEQLTARGLAPQP